MSSITQKLTQKQQRFVDEYIKSGNAMQSAIKAGYSEKYAKARSAQMLENVGIKSYIDAKMAEIESRKIADAKEVLQFYTRVLREEETEEVALPAGKVNMLRSIATNQPVFFSKFSKSIRLI